MAQYSDTFEEEDDDVLLKGGRFSNTPTLGPGKVRSLGDDNNGLPVNVPPETYFICAVVDPDNRINESTESNNSSCSEIKINGLG